MGQRDAAGAFAQCALAFVPSQTLTPKYISDLSAIAKDNGAEVVEPREDGLVNITRVTHIIANSIDFPQYTEAQEHLVAVVTSDWIKQSIARNKAQQLRPYSPDPRMIFSKVVVSCAGLPVLDKESITGAVMAMGGMESQDVGRTTTHICALTSDDPKCVAALQKGFKGKIVLPHWFDDCFRLGKRIEEHPYTLPDAEILRLSSDDEVKIPSSNHLKGATAALPDALAELPDKSSLRSPMSVFQRRKILLSWDLNISPRLRKIIGALIIRGNGTLVEDVESCDMLICQYREGEQYVEAAQSGKEIGNLAWLYHLITHDEWTSPLRRLLHYPIPKEPIPGFENLRITLSNYGGEARIYLENLIKAAGATFTKTMKSDNTHLITARNSSEKCEAAADWNVIMVNHLWIEESYAKCEAQSASTSKYTHFPPRTNLGEIIGQTFLDERKLRQKYYPGEEEALSPNIVEAKSRGRTGCVAHTVSRKQKDFAVLRDGEEDLPGAGKAKRKSSARQQVGDSFATPARGLHIHNGKENDSPSVVSTGGRSAKNKALSNLHKIAPDVALYEKEKKRSSKEGHGPWGGRRAADEFERTMATQKRSPVRVREDEDEDEENKRPAKRQRPSLPAVEMRVVLTGFQRWVGDKSKEDSDRRKLRDLGIQIVQENQPCDYLVAPQMVRTIKFLRTLARGPTVLSSAFIDKVLETGKVPDIDSYLLKDRESEKKFGVTLETAIARARANRGRLLQGIPIYCTANIRNGPEPYQGIAEANGAIFKVYRARSGPTIKPTTAEEDGGAPPDPVYLLSSNSTEERQTWKRFEEMAYAGHMEPRIVSADWLLDVAMRQEVVFDKKYLTTRFFTKIS